MISVLVCVYLETLKYLLYFSETIDHFLVHLWNELLCVEWDINPTRPFAHFNVFILLAQFLIVTL